MAKETPTSTPDFEAIAAKLLERSQEKYFARAIFEQAKRIVVKHGIHGLMKTKRIPYWFTPQVIVRDTAEIILGNPDNVIALTLDADRQGGEPNYDEFSISAMILGTGPNDVIGETSLYTLRRDTVLNIREQEASPAEVGEAQALLDYIESALVAKGASRVPAHSAQRV